MIISGKQIQDALKVYADQNQKAKPAARSQQSVSKRDEVVLSPKAQEFSQLLQKLKAMPEVREEKVAELTARIEAGEYAVDAKDIVEKMLGRTLVDRLR
ncbi:flagellar biosynthesis protein FlgM [Anaerosporomusa subterranea]|uniref:Negative regulator of flagellin synthesis n=1 Tax=Anaerosporomusa subterranea TaxID=1794912 RepID=A0A154BRC5_ANASB|nr:flagellar biosynthesis anti-sigma factor FlgM [Anaerosporomusa subterranea]KYZ76481.1 flagellar biosynthesis protein FlgM [Anaerosporomusa subterranea]